MKQTVQLFLLFLFFTSSLGAKSVAIVISRKIPEYESALAGIKEKLGKTNQYVYFLDATPNSRRTMERLKKYPFDCYVTVGGLATREILAITDKKLIVCCYTLYEPTKDSLPIHMAPYLPPGKALAKRLKDLCPERNHRVGTIWCHETLSEIVERYEEEFKKEQCSLKVSRVKSPHDVPKALRTMADEIDAFLLLPEPAIMQKDALRHLLLTFLQKGKPVIAFSPGLVRAGALYSLSYPPREIGQYTGLLAHKLLFDIPEKIDDPPLEFSSNERVARYLGIEIKD